MTVRDSRLSEAFQALAELRRHWDGAPAADAAWAHALTDHVERVIRQAALPETPSVRPSSGDAAGPQLGRVHGTEDSSEGQQEDGPLPESWSQELDAQFGEDHAPVGPAAAPQSRNWADLLGDGRGLATLRGARRGGGSGSPWPPSPSAAGAAPPSSSAAGAAGEAPSSVSWAAGAAVPSPWAPRAAGQAPSSVSWAASAARPSPWAHGAAGEAPSSVSSAAGEAVSTASTADGEYPQRQATAWRGSNSHHGRRKGRGKGKGKGKETGKGKWKGKETGIGSILTADEEDLSKRLSYVLRWILDNAVGRCSEWQDMPSVYPHLRTRQQRCVAADPAQMQRILGNHQHHGGPR